MESKRTCFDYQVLYSFTRPLAGPNGFDDKFELCKLMEDLIKKSKYVPMGVDFKPRKYTVYRCLAIILGQLLCYRGT